MSIKSAITLYKGNQSSALSKPLMSGETVTEKSVDAGRSMRRSALLLMRKRIQRDKLEAKYFRLIDRQKRKEKSRNEEDKQEKTSFLSGVGSGIKQSAAKLGGNLFGAIGDLLGFLALNWIADPKNKKTLEGIVSGLKSVLKFVDWFVTGSVDNFFSGFYKMVKEDSTLLERFVGFFQMAVGAIGIYYSLNPLAAVKDAFKLIKGGPRNFRILKHFFKKWQKQGLGKALKFMFPKTSKVVENIAKKFTKVFQFPKTKELLSKILNKITIKGTNFLKGNNVITAIAKRLLLLAKNNKGTIGKQVSRVLKVLAKPFKSAIKNVPLVGPFLSIAINRAFGDDWDAAVVKALGFGLGQWIGAGIGTLLLPGIGTLLGGFIGGLIGEFLSSRLLAFLTNPDRKALPPDAYEKKRAQLIQQLAKDYEGDEEGLREAVATEMRKWQIMKRQLETKNLVVEYDHIESDDTYFDIRGYQIDKIKSGHFVSIKDELMKVIKTEMRTIQSGGKTGTNIKELRLYVNRGLNGTTAVKHYDGDELFLHHSDPPKFNGTNLVFDRTNDLKNGSENKILEEKTGNGNGETTMIINGGDVFQNNTNINSQITSDTTIEENLQVQNN